MENKLKNATNICTVPGIQNSKDWNQFNSLTRSNLPRPPGAIKVEVSTLRW